MLRLYINRLDESGETHACKLWNYLKNILKDSKGQLSICVSCQPYPDVVFNPDFYITVDHKNEQDIATYLHTVFPAEERWQSRTDVETIQNTLKARACGVFQWIVLVTPSILELYYEDEDVVVASIVRAPTELSYLHEDMLNSVVQKRREDGIRALQISRLITFAVRPLSLKELRYAISTRLDSLLRSMNECTKSKVWCDSDDTMEKRIRRLSQGLARIVPGVHGSKAVAFDHESVKEHMLKRGIWFLEKQIEQEPQTKCVEGRAHYILFSISIRHLATVEASALTKRESHYDPPFLDYAIAYWMIHAKTAEGNGFSLCDIVDLTEWPSNRIWAQ